MESTPNVRFSRFQHWSTNRNPRTKLPWLDLIFGRSVKNVVLWKESIWVLFFSMVLPRFNKKVHVGVVQVDVGPNVNKAISSLFTEKKEKKLSAQELCNDLFSSWNNEVIQSPSLWKSIGAAQPLVRI